MEYPYNKTISVDLITPNLYNPNIMSDEEFELLERNISEVGFLDPILVIPKQGPEGKEYYQIVDGEHRFEAQRILGFEEIPAVVADPELFDEKTQKLQTVRMNQIRGSLDVIKFNNLVNDLINNHGVPFDDLASELGFADLDEFQQLIDETRRSLPNTPGMRTEFDKKVKDVKNYDDLVKLVDRLFKKFGDTLPANFMILDFDRQHNILIKMNPSTLANILAKFREILVSGYTVDSVLYQLIKDLNVESFVSTYASKLKTINSGVDVEDALNEMQEMELN